MLPTRTERRGSGASPVTEERRSDRGCSVVRMQWLFVVSDQASPPNRRTIRPASTDATEPPMSPTEINAILARTHPAAAALLSPLGRRAALPEGIPQQTEQARRCERQATIGEITDGTGVPLTLPSLSRHFTELNPTVALRYAPQRGLTALRTAWRDHLAKDGIGGVDGAPASLPLVTTGITHAMSLCAELFCAPGTPVLIATPYWDNYDTIFEMRTAGDIRTFPFYDADGGYNVAGLRAALAALTGPAMVVLNFPANPTGYTPRVDEIPALVEAITRHPLPLAVLCDDAYQGLQFEPGAHAPSVYGPLARAADPTRTLVCKVDGATKELVFFGGRVGFLTFSATGEAAEALGEKAAALIRSSISSGPAPSQAAVLAALQSGRIEAEQSAVLTILRDRYLALKEAFRANDLIPAPHNSGCFAYLPLPAGVDAEAFRQRLITEHSVGVIAIRPTNGIRIAFCSIEAADIPDLVARVAGALRRSSPEGTHPSGG